MIRIKRAYEEVSDRDGSRILVDRLWPRGISKDRARIDRWAKELSPSTELRKWFGHDPKKWVEFQKRYRNELSDRQAELNDIAQEARRGPVTLVYGARDTEHNEAAVLRDMISQLG